jgi:hypothetical protein
MVRRFSSDNSLQILDAANDSANLPADEACAKRGFVLVGDFFPESDESSELSQNPPHNEQDRVLALRL